MSVTSLLARLGLSRYADIFEEEAITSVDLLVSMGPDMLRSNLEELGLTPEAIATLAADLFGGGRSAAVTGSDEGDDDGVDALLLEENEDAPAMPSGGAVSKPSHPPPPAEARIPMSAESPRPGAEVSQEEIDAAEAEAQWLLNPLSMVDLSHAKEMLLEMMAEGIGYQRAGQYANARAVFTRALGLEAPNPRMNAALHYNRAACHRALGQLGLALRDAQQATQIEPTLVRAHWRAAEVALAMGKEDEAREAIDAGLKHEPRCQPLLQLKLRVQRF